ncbi:MAG TPA: 2OG-Fe(II) oxygenase [Noviherbaspirillum sp.]|nr:2OG-Fe(II) oxygenase [Noviherbaspirillum sp.]
MMTLSALASLPQEWQLWINQNLARACTPRSMAEVMVRDGKFDQRLACAAIEEARRAGFVQMPALQASPQIDTSANTIRTPDRTVNVLLTLKAPRIVLLGNVLADEECDALVAYTEQRMLRSPVVGDSEGRNEIHAYRTSRGAMLARGECELVERIEARLAALTHWPAERGEGLQVLRYEPGNEYRPHYDWFNPDLPGPRKHMERGGQRVATIVMYLSDVAQGGATSFPNVGLEVQPKKGCAVFFANTDAYGIPDQQTLHAGEPVVAGSKVIATKWLRERTYG